MKQLKIPIHIRKVMYLYGVWIYSKTCLFSILDTYGLVSGSLRFNLTTERAVNTFNI